MKATIVILVVLASLTAIIVQLDEARLVSQRLAASQCQAYPSSCFKPGVSFASLH
ncbi:hypothetical protein FQZ97_1073600 [compost metagenome]